MKKKVRKVIQTVMLFAVVLATVLYGTHANADAPEPQMDIKACNLSFNDSIYIKYAVATANVADEDVSVLIWTEPQSAYTYENKAYELSNAGRETVNGTSCLIFDFTKLAAKNMTDDVYARTYTKVNDQAYYGALHKYSVLQYVYNKLGKTGTATDNLDLKALLQNMLSYGASAQTYFQYHTDRLASADFYQVKVEGGVFAFDQSAVGLFSPGRVLTLDAPANNGEGEAFDHWVTSSGTKLAGNTFTVGTANETITAVYAQQTVPPSAGLEFESNGDGTAIVLSMGDCTDTDVVIPSTTPDGDIVTEIDASAFANMPIRSITIPVTVTNIGRRAFNGCTSLTDVYYDGTEEQWNEIGIGTYNAPLNDATKHFKEAAATEYTVTFQDWNGTVLKTQKVKSGESATAPADPSRDGYTFTGWDKSFGAVTSDLIVTAVYEVESTGPCFYGSTVTTTAGSTGVNLSVSIKNNPGILGMLLSVEYDEDVLTLTKTANGNVTGALTYQGPSKLVSGCNFVWYGSQTGEIADGTVLDLEFTVAADAPAGTYPIVISCSDADTYDAAYNTISATVVNGSITVG